MPRSYGLMRPSAVTAAASVNTRAAPPTAREPRWTKCQSVEYPSTLEYWHIGDTRIRLASVRERSGNGSNRCGIAVHCPPERDRTPRVLDGHGVEGLVDDVRQRLDGERLHQEGIVDAAFEVIGCETRHEH